jgi:hypothetical protein
MEERSFLERSGREEPATPAGKKRRNRHCEPVTAIQKSAGRRSSAVAFGIETIFASSARTAEAGR